MTDIADLIGTVRRFGSAGPRYEVVDASGPATAGEPRVRIRVLDTGEEVDYPAAASRDDPREA